MKTFQISFIYLAISLLLISCNSESDNLLFNMKIGEPFIEDYSYLVNKENALPCVSKEEYFDILHLKFIVI